MDEVMERGASLSDDGRFRYTLWRQWDRSTTPLTFIMLNPSTADATVDDPTIRRCMGFARRDGFGGIRVANLFAFRTSSPAELKAAGYPEGPRNTDVLLRQFRHALGPVVAAWGTHAVGPNIQYVADLAKAYDVPLLCLGVTKDGRPKHPLYVPAAQPLIEFVPALTEVV